MAATPGKFEKVVIDKEYLFKLEESQLALWTLLKGLKHYSCQLIRDLNEMVERGAMGPGSRYQVSESVKILESHPVPIMNISPDRWQLYVPPSDNPDVKRLEEREQEMMKDLDELRAFRARALPVLVTHGRDLMVSIAHDFSICHTKEQIHERARMIEFLNQYRAERK